MDGWIYMDMHWICITYALGVYGHALDMHGSVALEGGAAACQNFCSHPTGGYETRWEAGCVARYQ